MAIVHALEQSLLETIVDRDNLQRAWKHLKVNQRAAGVDAIAVADFPAWAQQHWPTIKTQLMSGDYQPNAVRRVWIPKPNGDKWPLGIPTIADRVIQQAIAQQLAPHFKREFSHNCYGFRPGRNAHQAMAGTRVYPGETPHGRGYRFGRLLRQRQSLRVDAAAQPTHPRQARAATDRPLFARGRHRKRAEASDSKGRSSRRSAIAIAGQHLVARAGCLPASMRPPVCAVRRRFRHLRAQPAGGRAGADQSHTLSGTAVETARQQQQKPHLGQQRIGISRVLFPRQQNHMKRQGATPLQTSHQTTYRADWLTATANCGAISWVG